MKPKIVLLEDDHDLRYIYSEILTIAGYDIVSFETIAAFKKGISFLDVDLLLCDVYLPDGSGIDLCNELKAVPHKTPSAIVMMSAYTSNHDIVSKCSPDAVFTKPYGLSYLTELVESLVNQVLDQPRFTYDQSATVLRKLQAKFR